MNAHHVGVEARAVNLRAEHGWPALPIGCGVVELVVDVPPSAKAVVQRAGLDGELLVSSGTHRWVYEVPDEVAATWAPLPNPWERLA